MRVPEVPVYLDALLPDQPLAGGLEPRLGDHHLRVLTITGFPGATTPGLLDELNRLAFPYRWSTRAILIDKLDALYDDEHAQSRRLRRDGRWHSRSRCRQSQRLL